MRRYIVPTIIILIIYMTNCSFFTPAEYWHDSVIGNHIFSDGIISFALNTAYNEIPYDHAGYRILVYNMETGLVADQIVFTDNEDDPVHICKTNNYIYSSQSKYKININTGEQELIEDSIISDLINYEVSPNGEECIYYTNGAFKYFNFATDEMRSYDCSYSEGRYNLDVDWDNRNIIYTDNLDQELITIGIDTYEINRFIGRGDIVNDASVNFINRMNLIGDLIILKLNVELHDSTYTEYIKFNNYVESSNFELSDEFEFYSNENGHYYIEITKEDINHESKYVLRIYDIDDNIYQSYIISDK